MLECILKNEFFWNLYANTRIPKHVQNLAKFIYAIQHTSVHRVFLSWLNSYSELDMKLKWEKGKALELDVTKISCLKTDDEESFWLISGPNLNRCP